MAPLDEQHFQEVHNCPWDLQKSESTPVTSEKIVGLQPDPTLSRPLGRDWWEEGRTSNFPDFISNKGSTQEHKDTKFWVKQKQALVPPAITLIPIGEEGENLWPREE